MTSVRSEEAKLTFHMALVASALMALLAGSVVAHASDGVLSEADQQCLSCHSQVGLEKSMADGESLSLHIPGKAFAQSVHNAIGCAGCHTDIDLAKHPRTSKKKISVREHSIALVEACRQCHADKFKLYEGSIHASLVREGNPVAPLCTDCHDPHSVRAKTASEPIGEVPCRKCHSAIYHAYAESIHGRARASGKQAPICADCHRAHDVNAAATGDQLKNACLACHKEALAAHRKWLPNAERHFEAVSCPACHSPKAARRVDLMLYDNVAHERVAERLGVPQFETRARSADTKGLGLDTLALQSLLKEFNREGSGNTILRGRLEVSTGVEAHQLAGKSEALRDCDGCHREGAAPFQTVAISIVSPDGRPLRYGAQKEVLNSARSVDSVGGFYAIGGTRIKLLDTLLVLALVAGIGVPTGHLSLKWLFRKYLKKSDEAGLSGPPPSDSRPLPGDGSDTTQPKER